MSLRYNVREIPRKVTQEKINEVLNSKLFILKLIHRHLIKESKIVKDSTTLEETKKHLIRANLPSTYIIPFIEIFLVIKFLQGVDGNIKSTEWKNFIAEIDPKEIIEELNK